MVTLTRSLNEPIIGGSMFLEGSITPSGTEIRKLRSNLNEINAEQAIGGLAGFAVNAAYPRSQQDN